MAQAEGNRLHHARHPPVPRLRSRRPGVHAPGNPRPTSPNWSKKTSASRSLVDSDFAFFNGRLARHYRTDAAVKPGAGIAKGRPSIRNPRRGGLAHAGRDSQGHRRWHQHLAGRARRFHQRAHPRRAHPAAAAGHSGHRAGHSRRHLHPRPARQTPQQRILRPSATRPSTRPASRLENYDPVGVWRDSYGRGRQWARRSIPPASRPKASALPTSPPGSGSTSKRAGQLARGFATQFLTYATGAPPRFSNEAALDHIVTDTAEVRTRTALHHCAKRY